MWQVRLLPAARDTSPRNIVLERMQGSGWMVGSLRGVAGCALSRSGRFAVMTGRSSRWAVWPPVCIGTITLYMEWLASVRMHRYLVRARNCSLPACRGGASCSGNMSRSATTCHERTKYCRLPPGSHLWPLTMCDRAGNARSPVLTRHHQRCLVTFFIYESTV